MPPESSVTPNPSQPPATPAAVPQPPSAQPAPAPSPTPPPAPPKDISDPAKVWAAEALGFPKPDATKVEPTSPAATPPADKGKRKQPRPSPPPSPPARTDEDIAATAAAAAARAVADVMKPSSPPPPAEPKLDPGVAKTLGVLEHMARQNPDKYGDPVAIKGRYLSSRSKLAEYQAKWEKDNPGETFDEDADEHAGWMESNVFAWDDDDFEDARIDMAAKRHAQQIADEKVKAINDKLSEFEKKEKLRESQNAIMSEQMTAAKKLLGEFGNEYAGVIKDDGSLDMPKLKALEDSDPVGHEIRANMWRNLDIEVAEVYPFTQGLKPWDPNNKPLANFAAFADQQEKILMSLPPADRVDDQGRQFLPAAQYRALKDRPGEQQSRYWTYSTRELCQLRAAFYAAQANKIIAQDKERLRKMAASMGIQLPTGNGQPSAAVASTAAKTAQKPTSPPAGGGPRMAGNKTGSGEMVSQPTTAWLGSFLS